VVDVCEVVLGVFSGWVWDCEGNVGEDTKVVWGFPNLTWILDCGISSESFIIG
jgi:hypothetical protein